MGKTIIAENDVQKTIVKLIDKSGVVIGLIVGKCSSQKDAALHLIPTPSEQAVQEDNDVNPTSVDAFCEQWIAEHARQVSCMLPGGIGVIGVFYVCPPDQANQGGTKARQALFAIHKLLSKRQLLTSDQGQDTLEWSMLHICKSTRKTSCKTVNVLDHKSTARPAELKYQTSGHKWSTIKSTLHLNVGILLPSAVEDCSHYSKQLTTRLSPIFRMIDRAIALVDGQLRSGSDALESSQGKKKTGKKGGSSSGNDGGTHTIELLTEKNDIMSKTKDMDRTTGQAHVHIMGTISSRAFVDPKATVDEAVQAIKQDLVRSIHARFDLLASELRQSSGDEEIKEVDIDPPAVIATPRRILARLHGSPIVVSDYAFAEEQAVEIAERMSELLNVELMEEDLDLETEALPDDSLLDQDSMEGAEGEESLVEGSQAAKSMKYVGAAAAGVMGVILAGAMSYLALTDD